MGRVAAFFDLDNTLVDGNTGRLWVQYVRKHSRGELRLRDAVRTAVWVLKYKLHMIDVFEVTRRALTLIKGQSEVKMLERCQHWFVTTVRPALFPESAELVAKHRADGHLTSILTASTRYAAEPVAAFLGIDEALHTHLEVKDGLFTGAINGTPCYGDGKVFWAQALARQHDIDLAKSYFYTDSIHDLEMLEAVGHPHCVNPDRKLARVARARGWPILRFKRARL